MCESFNKYRAEFWGLIEKELGLPISLHLKNILKLADLDNYAAIAGLKVQGVNFLELEDFVRSENYYSAVPSGTSLSDFYGNMFKRNRTAFKFSIGEKSILKQIFGLVWDTSATSKISTKQWKAIGKKHLRTSSARNQQDVENDVDKEAEMNKIRSLIQNKAKKDFFTPQIAEHLPTIVIEVVINAGAEIVAALQCPLCDIKIQIKKIQNEKWNTANFIRHFSKHDNKSYGRKATNSAKKARSESTKLKKKLPQSEKPRCVKTSAASTNSATTGASEVAIPNQTTSDSTSEIEASDHVMEKVIDIQNY